MQNTPYYLLGATLGAVFCLTMTYGHAQDTASGPQPGDPARWYVADTTAAAQLRTLRKEIGAAYQEAQTECKRGPAAARGACLKDARNTYQQDLANAEAQRQKANPR